MALKTTNYEVKEVGLVLPEAYALITNIKTYISGGVDKGEATVVIQKSREACRNLRPIYSFVLTFDVNRNENPYKTAYDILKSERTVTKPDYESRVMVTRVEKGYCFGWDDDYYIDESTKVEDSKDEVTNDNPVVDTPVVNEPTVEVETEESADNEVEGIITGPLVYTEGDNTLDYAEIVLEDESARAAVFVQNEGTVLTITDGTYDASPMASATSAPAVYARDGGRVVISGGEFIGGEGCSCIYAKNNAVVEINGGRFSTLGAGDTNQSWVLNLGDNSNSSIVVKGGTFVNFNPADNLSEGPNTNFVAEGYEVQSVTLDDGTVEYTVVNSVVETVRVLQ